MIGMLSCFQTLLSPTSLPILFIYNFLRTVFNFGQNFASGSFSLKCNTLTGLKPIIFVVTKWEEKVQIAI